MRNLSYYFFLLLALSLCTCTPNENIGDTKASEENLIQAIEKFNKAFQEGDVTTLEAMITDNYQHSNGTSKAIGKENWLNYLRKRQESISSGELVVEQYQMDETQMEWYGNSAFVTARISTISRRGEEVSENAYRVSHLWVYQSGSWKRAGFHDGKIK